MAILAECPCHRKQSLRNKKCKAKACGEDLEKAKRSGRVRYWITYRLPDGRQRREAVGYSLEEARASDAKRTVQKKENRILDIKPDTKMTFKELAEWYLGLERVKALASYARVEQSLKKFNTIFGEIILSKIKVADLENYQARAKAEGLADNTIDHEIGTAKTMIFKAFDNDLVGGDTYRTFKKIRKMLKRNANARNRILTYDEFHLLLEHAPAHLKPILVTGFYTGMRLGEILNLIWDKVDLKNRIICLEASDTKDREPRIIPICDELYEVLNVLPRAIHDPHVFLFRGKPIENIKRALRETCEEAGIPYGRFVKGGFIFHDLRHTFNTYMRKAGVPESVIMSITGHSTREMFDRYNTVDLEDAQNAIGQLGVFLKNVDHSVDQAESGNL